MFFALPLTSQSNCVDCGHRDFSVFDEWEKAFVDPSISTVPDSWTELLQDWTGIHSKINKNIKLFQSFTDSVRQSKSKK